MPLPSVVHGAKQCTVNCKRTGIRCKNPCAFGSKRACRLHGSHRSKNVLKGANHPQYRHGEKTKESIKEHQKTLLRLHTLEEIGHHIKMFVEGSPRTRGRKPTGWEPLDLNDPNQLALAILKTIKE